MAYLVVDKDRTEKIFQDEPIRKSVYWSYDDNSYFIRTDCVCLPNGSIEKLIGKSMSWEDDPIEITD